MTNFIHRWLNPHCPYCKADKEDNSICASCETLNREVERLIAENKRLLDRILEQPKVEEKVIEREIKPIMPRGAMSWKVRREILEQQDREKARLIREAPKPSEDLLSKSIKGLEKELEVENG